MSTRQNLLKLLEDNAGSFVSGQKVGEELQVSRNAIWKATEQLRREGYNIESKPSIGYRLKTKNNMLTKDAIESVLRYPCDLKVYDSIDSTNDQAKLETIKDKPLVIVANKQTAGRGRLGRTFASPSGTGLYLSIAFKPDFALDKSLYITMVCAIATCRAIEKVSGVNVKVKWVNDIFLGNKKVCGILTEAQTNFETGKIDNLIMGIGVNCFSGNLPAELSDVAGTLSKVRGSFSRNVLAAEIINEVFDILNDFDSRAFFREYKSKCFILGKQIYIHPTIDSVPIRAKAIDINDDGGLVVEYLEGRKSRLMETLTTGEVSIRLTK